MNDEVDSLGDACLGPSFWELSPRLFNDEPQKPRPFEASTHQDCPQTGPFMHQVSRCRLRSLRSPRIHHEFATLKSSRWKFELLPKIAPLTHNGSRRHFSLESIPAVLLPPVVFGGLLITLWTYKCLMMIIFQNKIIYQPSLPPFSRSEKLSDYVNQCKPVLWEDHPIRSTDGTKLTLLEGSIAGQRCEADSIHVVVLYFQGNGSSLPPRLPYLSNIMKQLHAQSKVRYTFVALSYRGFWTSSGSASQRGIELDAQAALKWVSDRYGGNDKTRFVIYGQSIGAGVAATATARWLTEGQDRESCIHLQISGLLLETPFTSLREMLVGLYPQKFLPYRYLGPFLMSIWDSRAALFTIDEVMKRSSGGQKGSCQVNDKMKVLLLEAGADELVPEGNAALLMKVCQECQHIQADHKIIRGALHTNVMMQASGKKEIVQFLRTFEN